MKLGIPGLRAPRRHYLVQIDRRDKWLGDDGLIFAFKTTARNSYRTPPRIFGEDVEKCTKCGGRAHSARGGKGGG